MKLYIIWGYRVIVGSSTVFFIKQLTEYLQNNTWHITCKQNPCTLQNITLFNYIFSDKFRFSLFQKYFQGLSKIDLYLEIVRFTKITVITWYLVSQNVSVDILRYQIYYYSTSSPGTGVLVLFMMWNQNMISFFRLPSFLVNSLLANLSTHYPQFTSINYFNRLPITRKD